MSTSVLGSVLLAGCLDDGDGDSDANGVEGEDDDDATSGDQPDLESPSMDVGVYDLETGEALEGAVVEATSEELDEPLTAETDAEWQVIFEGVERIVRRGTHHTENHFRSVMKRSMLA